MTQPFEGRCLVLEEDTVHLKDRLSDIKTDCCDRLHAWLLRIVGASTGSTSMALACRWRSRPQHQKRPHAVQHTVTSLLRWNSLYPRPTTRCPQTCPR